MKRNWHLIRAKLRDGESCDDAHRSMIEDLSITEREAIAAIDDDAWSAMSEIARAAGFWHSDIGAPALPTSLIIDIAEAA